MTRVRLAAIQMSSGDAVSRNLEEAGRLLRGAADQGSRIAVLPENFARMGAEETERIAIAEPAGCGPIQDFLSGQARSTGMWIVGGTIPVVGEDPARPFSSCFVYDAQGVYVARYDKIHLFDVSVPGSAEAYHESAAATPGSRPLTLDTPWGRLGVAVCYDLRFPELFLHMSDQGMEVLALPAAFTVKTGSAHWQVLLRARAIENLCYVAGAGQTGTHAGGRRTYGHSHIIDPWGEVLADAGTKQTVIHADLDMDRLTRLRREFPVTAHRRRALLAPKS